MGYYIQAPGNHGKAEYLIAKYGAERLPGPPEWHPDKAIICVVDNGPFEAAGYAYDPSELEVFKSPDMHVPQRPRTWLLMDKKLAEELSGFSK